MLLGIAIQSGEGPSSRARFDEPSLRSENVRSVSWPHSPTHTNKRVRLDRGQT